MDASGKIVDRGLRSFADSDEGDVQQSVIVELAAPAVGKPRTYESRLSPVERLRPVERLSPADMAVTKPDRKPNKPVALTEHGVQLDALEEQLSAIVNDDLVRLNAAEAFVVNVNPDQLRAICALGLVGTIRPNRVHSVGNVG